MSPEKRNAPHCPGSLGENHLSVSYFLRWRVKAASPISPSIEEVGSGTLPVTVTMACVGTVLQAQTVGSNAHNAAVNQIDDELCAVIGGRIHHFAQHALRNAHIAAALSYFQPTGRNRTSIYSECAVYMQIFLASPLRLG